MATTPAPTAPAAPLWRDTHAGRCEAWIHRLIFNGQREPDYHDAQEFMGHTKAARMVHGENRRDA